MDFLTYLKTNAEAIDAQLNSYFSQWREKVEEVSPKLLHLIDASIEANQGGKRLRGVLIKLGYDLGLSFLTSSDAVPDSNLGSINMSEALTVAIDSRLLGNDNQEIYKAGVAYEIFQTAILAHDDIIDKSPLRRGQPTLYAKLGSDHYAISQTICLGDLGIFQCFQILSQLNFPDKQKNLAIQAFSQNIISTVYGEILDVELPYLKTPQTEEDILTISKYKTAWYTIVGPMQLGATLAGADQSLLDKIKTFGENLGIAFQIQDDILGIFGDEKILGKSVTSDVEEGKLTLLIIQALKNANPDQKDFLAKHYGNGKVSDEQLAEIKQIFEKTGALFYAQKKAEEYVAEAKKSIINLTDNTDFTNLLTQMSDFLIKRSK